MTSTRVPSAWIRCTNIPMIQVWSAATRTTQIASTRIARVRPRNYYTSSALCASERPFRSQSFDPMQCASWRFQAAFQTHLFQAQEQTAPVCSQVSSLFQRRPPLRNLLMSPFAQILRKLIFGIIYLSVLHLHLRRQPRSRHRQQRRRHLRLQVRFQRATCRSSIGLSTLPLTCFAALADQMSP